MLTSTIELALCMSHYNEKIIADEKVESGGSSSFGDLTSQISLRRKERVIKFGYLSPENGFNFEKNEFLCEFLCPESFFSTQD